MLFNDKNSQDGESKGVHIQTVGIVDNTFAG